MQRAPPDIAGVGELDGVEVAVEFGQFLRRHSGEPWNEAGHEADRDYLVDGSVLFRAVAVQSREGVGERAARKPAFVPERRAPAITNGHCRDIAVQREQSSEV